MNKREITVQITGCALQSVVQATEPDAARLLIEKGGQVMRYALHHLYYWDHIVPEEQRLLCWPAGTFSAYVSPRGQEDTMVTFAVFLLPDSSRELHLVYDYRPSAFSGQFEEYFTLRVAREQDALFQ